MKKSKHVNYEQLVQEAEREWYRTAEYLSLYNDECRVERRLERIEESLTEELKSTNPEMYYKKVDTMDSLLLDKLVFSIELDKARINFVNRYIIQAYKGARKEDRGTILDILVFNGLDKAINDCKAKLAIETDAREREIILDELDRLQDVKNKCGQLNIKNETLLKYAMTGLVLWAVINHEKVDIFNTKFIGIIKSLGLGI